MKKNKLHPAMLIGLAMLSISYGLDFWFEGDAVEITIGILRPISVFLIVFGVSKFLQSKKINAEKENEIENTDKMADKSDK
jgi:vacuolar-type H+-ATPase subunit I/STV1